MINLKEAGRYSNYFNMSLNSLYLSLANMKSKLVKETEKHNRSLSLPGSKDEEKVIVTDPMFDSSIEELEAVISKIIAEKLKIANAIAEAKSKMTIEIDGQHYAFDTAIEQAKILRECSSLFLSRLERYKNSSIEKKGYDKTFNNEGNQVPYEYPIVVESEVIFNIGMIKERNKAVKSLADKLSMEVEEKSSLKLVDYSTDLNYLDSVDELIAKLK